MRSLLRIKSFSFFVTVLLFVLFANISSNSEEKKVLRWAADTESGAPYVYRDENNSSQLIGFEAEIIRAIARELGMDNKFIQNQWDGLIPGLTSRNDYDVVINGVEITADRKEEVNFSIPYFVTYEQIVVRKGHESVTAISDLIGKKVGTLTACYAERILKATGGIKVMSYESEVNAFENLKLKRIDAVLIDFPVALYYAKDDKMLSLVGNPIGEITYGIAIKKKDTVLLKNINASLLRIMKSGELQKIYEKYKLWGPFMKRFVDTVLANPDSTIMTRDSSFKDSNILRRKKLDSIDGYIALLPDFGDAALMTLSISIVSMLIAIILGLIIALLRVYAPLAISKLAILYIEVVRGTPLLIQLFLIFYALPKVFGEYFAIDPFWAAIIGLGCNYAAYEAENYRAGLFAVPRGQMEAAISLGMTRMQAIKHIIIPQAVRFVIPPVTNDFISLLKDSSLVSVIAMVELTKAFGIISQETSNYIGPGIMVAVIYLLIGLPFVKLAKMAEKKFSFDKKINETK